MTHVGCLFAGGIVRNLADADMIKININEIDSIGNISLNLFLSMALMNSSIWTLLDLAGPMIVILVTQTVVIMLYTYFVTFRAMGKTYDAAVMAAGHCGVGLGQTPNAIANMSSVIEEHLDQLTYSMVCASSNNSSLYQHFQSNHYYVIH